jgi:hypothetical protein
MARSFGNAFSAKTAVVITILNVEAGGYTASTARLRSGLFGAFVKSLTLPDEIVFASKYG